MLLAQSHSNKWQNSLVHTLFSVTTSCENISKLTVISSIVISFSNQFIYIVALSCEKLLVRLLFVDKGLTKELGG